MKKVRDTMLAEGGDLEFCYPASILNGRIQSSVCYGDINGLLIDAETVDVTTENIKRALKMANQEYGEENIASSHYSDHVLLIDEAESFGERLQCFECPFFGCCDAMDEDDEDSKWPLVNAVEDWERWSPESDGCKVSDIYWEDDINDWAAIAEKDGKEYRLTLDSDGDIQFSPEI